MEDEYTRKLISERKEVPPLPDMVNEPPHYRMHPSGVECIEITEHLNFCIGNAIKYLWRCDHKSNDTQDLEKALWYIEREIMRRHQYDI